jgi:hypothetical protein
MAETGEGLLLHLETWFEAFHNKKLTLDDDMSRLAANFMKEFAAFE